MANKTLEMLEVLEEKIESIKWLVAASFPVKRKEISSAINTIRRSAGSLSKTFSKGIAYENKIRKEWAANMLKRIT